ncbi:MAG: hypothetical protein J07HX5_00073 [halophilic archaeon J07HX5]|jgi:hypothetical protein|nr:MAG: hypothetical protein J07HX5_00073 [halophilic archaeon J07HX5]
MSSDPEQERQNTDRVTVQTYIPAYQREQWDTHADDLGMSRSEFVRTMVQAGRRGFGAETTDQSTGGDSERMDTDLGTQVESVLAERQPLSWEELLGAIAGDIENRVETAVEELQDAGRVRYSGPKNGYVLEDR